jgi:hypothetical protein
MRGYVVRGMPSYPHFYLHHWPVATCLAGAAIRFSSICGMPLRRVTLGATEGRNPVGHSVWGTVVGGTSGAHRVPARLTRGAGSGLAGMAS